MIKSEFDWRVEAVQKFVEDTMTGCDVEDESLSLVVGARGTESGPLLREILLHPTPDQNGHLEERGQAKEEVSSRLKARDLKRKPIEHFSWGELRESPWIILTLVGEAPFPPQVFFEALEHIFNDPDHR